MKKRRRKSKRPPALPVSSAGDALPVSKLEQVVLLLCGALVLCGLTLSLLLALSLIKYGVRHAF